MRINFTPNTSFRSITPIIAKGDDYQNVKDVVKFLASNDNYRIIDTTKIYKNKLSTGPLSKAAKDGKKVGLLITGEEYLKYCNTRLGKTSKTLIARHVDKKPVEFQSSDIMNEATSDKYFELLGRIDRESRKTNNKK